MCTLRIARPTDRLAEIVSMYRAGLALEEIGLHFGGRDHSTVFYALQRIRSLESESAELRATIHTLRARLLHTSH